MRRVVIGSRGSDLALWQTRHIAALLEAQLPGLEVAIEVISSRGDAVQDVPIAKIGGKGVFTKELEVALLEREVDLAVHSLKDLPTELPDGLCLGAIPPRENPQDVLVSQHYASLDSLPEGARVGTSSLRRQLQLRAARPDVEIADIRGNVPTRVRKLQEGQFDAILLAAAGMNRLGLAHLITEVLPPEIMLPAVGQGALAVELRSDDTWLRELLAKLNDRTAEAAVTAERALLRGMGGGCQTPLGALAVVEGKTLHLRAVVFAPDAAAFRKISLKGAAAEAEAIGAAAAAELLRQGVRQWILPEDPGPEAKSGALPLADRRIVVTRATSQSSGLAQRLEALGAQVLSLAAIEIHPVQPGHIPAPDAVDWLVFTSVNGVECFAQALQHAGGSLAAYRRCPVCAIGPATAEAVLAHGLPITLQPPEAVAERLLQSFLALAGTLQGQRFLLPRGNKAREILPETLRENGAEVTDLVVYETRPAPISDAEIEHLLAFKPDLVTFTSSSTVENLCAALGPERQRKLCAGAAMASIGPITSETARAHGLEVAVEPARYDIPALVEAVIAHFSQGKL